MKVLVTHNRYRSDVPSGENQVVDAEIDLMRSAGIEVVSLIESSDAIASGVGGMLMAAPGPVYSPTGVRKFKSVLSVQRPDVVHIHNVFPLLSPWIVRVAKEAGVPVVQTVHNYRHSCVNGLHFRKGRVCTDCLGTRFQLPGLLHGCYRGSRVQTAPMTLSQNVHRSTWQKGVDRYIALTRFMRDRLIESGIDENRVTVRPSWVVDHGRPIAPVGTEFLFVGRLEETKGLALLLDAWAESGRSSGRVLRVVGDGAMRDEVAAAAATDSSLLFEGRLSPDAVRKRLESAACLVFPSLWFEGYPLTIAEAFERGRPVLATNGGSVQSIVTPGNGWLVSPTTADLGDAMRTISQQEVAAKGRSARESFERDNSPRAAASSLKALYEDLVMNRAHA